MVLCARTAGVNRDLDEDTMAELTEAEAKALQQRIETLRLEHRDLDEIIHRLAEDASTDQLQLKRLKKRKLVLKDLISRLESDLIPDLDA